MLPAKEAEELARIALAAMDSEPVAWTWQYREQWHVTMTRVVRNLSQKMVM
jgi:hypothetical protein